MTLILLMMRLYKWLMACEAYDDDNNDQCKPDEACCNPVFAWSLRFDVARRRRFAGLLLLLS